MATAILNWLPGGGGGTQTVQYRTKNEGTFVNYSTLGPSANSETITSLLNNTLYEYRVVNDCSGGVASLVLGVSINMTCPAVTTVVTDTSVTVEFPAVAGDVDGYIVELLNDAGSVLIQSKTFAGPFNTVINTSFASLTASTSYNLRVKPKAGSITKSNCSLVPFTTGSAPACSIATNLSVNIS